MACNSGGSQTSWRPSSWTPEGPQGPHTRAPSALCRHTHLLNICTSDRNHWDKATQLRPACLSLLTSPPPPRINKKNSWDWLPVSTSATIFPCPGFKEFLSRPLAFSDLKKKKNQFKGKNDVTVTIIFHVQRQLTKRLQKSRSGVHAVAFQNPTTGSLTDLPSFLYEKPGTWHFTAVGCSLKGYVFVMETFSPTHWGFYLLTHQLKSSANFSLL